VDEISVDLSKGEKDELTFVKERMRDLEIFCPYFPVVEDEDIKIDYPGTPPKGLHSAQMLLNFF
jgi:DUF438 domain-containing protein